MSIVGTACTTIGLGGVTVGAACATVCLGGVAIGAVCATVCTGGVAEVLELLAATGLIGFVTGPFVVAGAVSRPWALWLVGAGLFCANLVGDLGASFLVREFAEPAPVVPAPAPEVPAPEEPALEEPPLEDLEPDDPVDLVLSDLLVFCVLPELALFLAALLFTNVPLCIFVAETLVALFFFVFANVHTSFDCIAFTSSLRVTLE